VAAIVDEEMSQIDFEKCSLPLLQPQALWSKSGRLETMGRELMQMTDRHKKKYVLSPTCEELIAQQVGQPSHLPVKLYQIGTKWRDEPRPRAGALRGREFLMKDGYSFHASPECLTSTYAAVCEAYQRILSRLCGPDGYIQGK
jgi:prolyl-tRNA synthetase